MALIQKDDLLPSHLTEKFSLIKDLGKHIGERSTIAIVLSAITQVIRLLRLKISDNAALGFFSWNQVISDAIVLGTLMAMFYMAFLLGKYIGKFLMPKNFNQKSNRIYRPTVVLVEIILSCLISLILINVFKGDPIIVIPLIFGTLFGIGAGLQVSARLPMVMKNNALGLLLALIGFIIISYQNDFYESLHAQIGGDEGKEISVEYMNDQYIFTSSGVYMKNGGVRFFKKDEIDPTMTK